MYLMGQCWAYFFFFLPKCSNILELHLLTDDIHNMHLFLSNHSILNLETNLNSKLEKVSQWLYAYKLSLSIESWIMLGVLLKLRYHVNKNIPLKLNYSLIYPFLIYGLLFWGNTYSTIHSSLIMLQKRAIPTITLSTADEHSEPLFKELEMLKLPYVVTLDNALFIYRYHNNLLQSSFENFFQAVSSRH